MMHVLVFAAAIATARDGARCASPTRFARVHLVDGMPFVTMRRAGVHVRVRIGADAARTFVLSDPPGFRGVELAQVRFGRDGSVVVSGHVVGAQSDTIVDVVDPACTRSAAITLNPG